MASPLLTTKLFIPPAPGGWVARPRLLERLDEIFAPGKKLSLISAPPGYGKSCLVSSWCASERPGRTTAWLSLDTADNDILRFLLYLVNAIRHITPDFGETIIEALQLPQPPPVESILIAIINEVAVLPGSIIIILDDYQVIQTTAIHDALTFILDHLPPQTRLVLISRVDPALPLARLRARGQLVELRAADLRFTADETTTFLNQVMALNLESEEIKLLETRTEGWIAGLQLAALSMQGRADAGNFIKSFSGSHIFILDYLTEETLECQPDSIRQFLLRTCILDRLTAPLCAAVAGQEDCQKTLEFLIQTNLFIIPLDDQQRWFRYHHLFAELLHAQLKRSSPELIQELHRRACDWYIDNNFPVEAIRHAYSSGDTTRTIDLAVKYEWDMLLNGNLIALIADLHKILPSELIRSNPWLLIYDAWACVVSGRLEEIEPCLQDIEKLIEESPLQDSQMYGNIAAIRAYRSCYQDDPRSTIQLAEQALRLLPEDFGQTRSIVYYTLAIASLAADDIQSACESFAISGRLGQESGNIHIAVPSTCALGAMHILMGQLSRGKETLEQAAKMARTPSGKPMPIFARVCSTMSQLYYERNELDAAEQYARQGIELSRLWGHIESRASNHLALARVLIARGNYHEAHFILNEAERLVHNLAISSSVLTAITACKVRLWLSAPEPAFEQAIQWLEQNRLNPDDKPNTNDELERLSIARVWIRQKRFTEADALLERLLAAARDGGRFGRVIEILPTLALSGYLQGKLPEALASLGEALSLAEPEGHTRAFLNEGEPVAALLQNGLEGNIWKDKRIAAYARKLLSLSELPTPAAKTKAPSIPPISDLAGTVTDRELEVLRLIADGLTNQEIASRLFITVGTVKAHTVNLYRKLDVNTRTQAVARARTANLI
jgi:LuxR family maltose regulon positive regulatory protein